MCSDDSSSSDDESAARRIIRRSDPKTTTMRQLAPKTAAHGMSKERTRELAHQIHVLGKSGKAKKKKEAAAAPCPKKKGKKKKKKCGYSSRSSEYRRSALIPYNVKGGSSKGLEY